MSREVFILRRVLEPHSVSTRCSFPSSTIEGLDDAATTSECDSYTLGGVSSDGRTSWVARGDRLEIISNHTSARLAAWKFCAELSGSIDVCVRAACEFKMQLDSILVVAIQLGRASSEICLFDSAACRIIKAISCKHVITCLEPVAAFQRGVDVSGLLNDALRCFTGILAVGTETGRLLLIDLRLDDEKEMFTESRPSPLTVVSQLDYMEQQRRDALEKGSHLCIELGADHHDYNKFHLVLPNGEVAKIMDDDSVSVTAIKCIHHVGAIAIGYNFGSYQLWHLGDLKILLTHNEEALSSSVTHFAFQEPEDDPRMFCYLWVGRGPVQSALRSDEPGSLCLYHMVFLDKDLVNGYGYVYQGLQNIGARFLYPLCANPLSPNLSNASGSRIISCSCIGEVSNGWYDENDSREIEAGTRDRKGNLMYVVWENYESNAGSQCYFGLFDLDRWYHSQMPRAIRLGGNSPEKGCSFFTMYNLSSVQTVCEPDQLIDVCVDPSSVVWFAYIGDHVSEEMLMPSAINLDAVCLAETGTVKLGIHGIQQRVLGELNRLGPSALYNPSNIFSQCLMSGLLPKTGDKSRFQDRMFQCESLLSVSLENSQLSFLTACVETLSSADFGQGGFGLRHLLHWCVQKVHDTKALSDKTCMSMFNGHSLVIDQQLECQLCYYSTQFEHLKFLLQALCLHSAPTTQQGLKDLQSQLNAVTMVKQRFDAIMWLISVKHLPELSEERLPSENVFQYPYRKLSELFDKLRGSLSYTNCLLIDQLVSQLGSSEVKRVWGTEFNGTGYYPPPSLYALLNIYCIVSAPYSHMLSIVYYLLLDLARLDDTDTDLMASEQFVKAFSLSESVWRTARGIWLLDHENFEASVKDLTHPSVVEKLSPSLQRAVVETLMSRNRPELAGQFLTSAQLPVDGLDDIKLHMRILLASGLVADAFEYQHQFTDSDTSEELLKCFVDSCLNCNSLDKLLQLPFSPSEEAAVETCLKNSGRPEHLELLVMHYLQRGCHVEAIRLNEKINERLMSSDPRDTARAINRNSIVGGYMKTLPLVQSMIAGTNLQLQHHPNTVQCLKPTPLSVVVRPGRTDGKVLSQAGMITAVFDKIEETRSKLAEPTTPFRRGDIGQKMHSYHTPFTGTPLSAKNQARTGVRPSTPVVFPSVSIDDERIALVPPSPIQPRVFGSPGASARIRNLKERVLAKIMKTSDRLIEPQSLLATPALKISPLPTVAFNCTLSTPHSILKVRGPSVGDTKPGDSIRRKKQLSFNLSCSDTSEDSSAGSISTVSPRFASSNRKQTRFAATGTVVEETEYTKRDSTEEELESPAPASLPDSDGEVSFNLRTVRSEPGSKSESNLSTVSDSKPEDDIDAGIQRPQPMKLEVSVSTVEDDSETATSLGERASSPSSPLTDLRKRTEMTMQRVRTSPQANQPLKENERRSEGLDAVSGTAVIVPPPQDQDEDSFQSAVSDLQSPPDSFADASSFTPPPSPRATEPVTPRGLELEPIGDRDSEQQIMSLHVSETAPLAVEPSFILTIPSSSLVGDIARDGHPIVETDAPAPSTSFQALKTALKTSPFRSPGRAKLVIAKRPPLPRDSVPIQSPYSFSQPTVLGAVPAGASQDCEEEMRTMDLEDSVPRETPEFTFSPPLTRSSRRRHGADRIRELQTSVPQLVTEPLLSSQPSMSPVHPQSSLIQRSPDRKQIEEPAASTPSLRRSRRLQGISPHIPPSDTPVQLFPVDFEGTPYRGSRTTNSTSGTSSRRLTQQKRQLPSRRELGMRLRHKITRPKKTTMK